MLSNTGYYPQGDLDGRRRPGLKKFGYEYLPFDRLDVKPYDILCTRQKSFIAAGIIFFSGTDGESAWLAHCGQVLGDGVTVSEAVYPTHRYRHIDRFLEDQAEDKVRLTLVRLREDLWPDSETKRRCEDFCEAYHKSLENTHYEFPALAPMAFVSIIRNSLPFIKQGKWEGIPEADQRSLYICSAIVKWGWWLASKELAQDLFPASLSKLVPSPQDIFDSSATRYVAGWRKNHYQRGR